MFPHSLRVFLCIAMKATFFGYIKTVPKVQTISHWLVRHSFFVLISERLITIQFYLLFFSKFEFAPNVPQLIRFRHWGALVKIFLHPSFSPSLFCSHIFRLIVCLYMCCDNFVKYKVVSWGHPHFEIGRIYAYLCFCDGFAKSTVVSWPLLHVALPMTFYSGARMAKLL